MQGNDILNNLICVLGIDYNLPEFTLDQLTESVSCVGEERLRDPQEVVDRDLSAHHADMIRLCASPAQQQKRLPWLMSTIIRSREIF